MKREVPEFFAHGWALVLFPEGTRTAPGASVKYKTGGVRLAIATNAPIVPIALNSGECWPKHSFLLYPGVIKVVFGDPISPEGKTPHELNEEVRSAIEGEMKLIHRNTTNKRLNGFRSYFSEDHEILFRRLSGRG